MKNKIVWLGHASLRIEGARLIYVDPWKLRGEPPKGDLVLVTHPHRDHCSPADIEKVSSPETVILCPPECVTTLGPRAKAIAPGESVTAKGVGIRGVPAYNLNKEFHPKDKKWLGFVVTQDGESIYIAGDTDFIPEMAELRGLDAALLPIGGGYTMSVAEAAEAAQRINAAVAIPIHYGDIIGSLEDGRKFQELCKVRTEILG